MLDTVYGYRVVCAALDVLDRGEASVLEGETAQGAVARMSGVLPGHVKRILKELGFASIYDRHEPLMCTSSVRHEVEAIVHMPTEKAHLDARAEMERQVAVAVVDLAHEKIVLDENETELAAIARVAGVPVGFIPPLLRRWQFHLVDGSSIGFSKPALLELEAEVELGARVAARNASKIAEEHLVLSTRVFVVHGQDVAEKSNLARLLQQLGLEPVILHEQPNQGRTLIEKFEHNATTVGFCVVLLTPDDEGRLKGADELRPRARQNVVGELFYFLAKLGRTRVCALYKGDVELPSDLHGIVYVPLDAAGAWRYELVRELRAAGYGVDANEIT